MRIVKNLTFTVSKPIFETNRGFALLEVDTKDRNVRALLRWNPILSKATYKIKIVNATTKEWFRHDLIRTQLLDDNKYIIAFWNPHEALESLTNLIPTLFFAGVIASIVGHFNRNNKTDE